MQVLRIERIVDEIRRGRVTKHAEETVYAASSLWPTEAGPQRSLELVRGHWTIENGQHHRRDRTQDEDRCTVRDSNSARILSLFRSLAIFLYEQQRRKRGGKQSLPDFERQVCRHPGAMICRFVSTSA